MTNFKEVQLQEKLTVYNTEDDLLTLIFSDGKIQVLFNLHSDISNGAPIASCNMNESTIEEYISEELMYKPSNGKFLLCIGSRITISGSIGHSLDRIITVLVTVSSIDDGVDNIKLTYKEEDGKLGCVMTLFNYMQNIEYVEKIS